MIALPLLLSTLITSGTPAPGTQVEQQLQTKDGGNVSYLLHLPKDYSADGAAAPMMFFLHGRGESHGPLSLVTKWGPPRMAARGDEVPYIVVSPQCPKTDEWKSDTQQARLVELLDSIIANYNVDTSRIYLTGLSMGGHGSWRLAAEHTSRFAAAAIICGSGDPNHAAQLAKLPIWAFHGDQDTAVVVEKSDEMVKAIRDAGGTKIRYTRLEYFGHNTWSAAYATPELYDWFDEAGKQNSSK